MTGMPLLSAIEDARRLSNSCVDRSAGDSGLSALTSERVSPTFTSLIESDEDVLECPRLGVGLLGAILNMQGAECRLVLFGLVAHGVLLGFARVGLTSQFDGGCVCWIGAGGHNRDVAE